MEGRRVETSQSRTADMTCGCRAASWMEKRPAFKSGDWVAPLLLPRKMQFLFRVRPVRRLLTRLLGPEGIYEWVIARTRYIDGIFEGALSNGVTQVLIIGAGFDSRAVRFKTAERSVRVFELDAAPTQQAKLRQYRARGIAVPANVTFVAINFDKETIEERLRAGGFAVGAKTLVIAEGVFQYITPDAAHATLKAVKNLVGRGSWLVFDYAHASVLRGEGDAYGQKRMISGTMRFGESWQFGLEKEEVKPLLSRYALKVKDLKDPPALQRQYFVDQGGKALARINGTQSIVFAEKTGKGVIAARSVTKASTRSEGRPRRSLKIGAPTRSRRSGPSRGGRNLATS